MSTDQTRQPTGVPTGGQFAATAHAEPTGVSLVEPPRIDEELDELTDDAQVGYEQAVDAVIDAALAARTAASYGSGPEREQYNALYDQAVADVGIAGRRRTTAFLAAHPSAGRPDFADYANPRNVTEVRNALKAAAAGKVHAILLRNEAVAKLDGRLDVAGPPDGTPLYVDLSSGFCPLRVTAGTVVVHARSTMGNGIEVGPDATVVVFADPDRKVSTRVEGGVAAVVGADGARGLQFNRGGVLDVVGATSGMTVRSATT